MRTRNTNPETLSGVAKIAIVVLVVSLGLWGCARRSDTPAGAAERIRVLESRCQKLEQDYRSVAQARDAARKEQAALESDNARLNQQIARNAAIVKEGEQIREQFKTAQNDLEGATKSVATLTAERDELKSQISLRLAERDQLNSRLDRLRKGVQQLMVQDDSPSAVATPAGPTLGSE